MKSLRYYVASRFLIKLHIFLFIAPSPHLIMATNNTNNLLSDITMESLMSEIRTLKSELTAIQAQEGFHNLFLDDCGRERSHRSHSSSSRPHNAKIMHFSNLPGENFLAWRSQFKVIADYHRWSDKEA